MMSSKELFQRNADDVKAALAITTSDGFSKLLTYARAQFVQNGPTHEQTEGANNFINILLNLPEKDVEAPDWIESGLHHDLSVPERGTNQSPQPQK